MLADRAEVVRTLARLADSSVIEQRLERLAGATSLSDLLRIAGIRYHAPSDAARTPLPDASVDLHFSFTVFQHIPADSLRSMLREASRVLAPGGLACHVIDPSDRFAHSDASVNFVNFLRYSDAEFARHNDNQFAYHNRLRVTELEQLYAEVNHEIVTWVISVDARSLQALRAGFPLAERYRNIAPELLATITVVAITRPRAAVHAG